jgi:hypothetical protein
MDLNCHFLWEHEMSCCPFENLILRVSWQKTCDKFIRGVIKLWHTKLERLSDQRRRDIQQIELTCDIQHKCQSA